MSTLPINSVSTEVAARRLRRFGLDGKAAVVLGGAGGIGSATAVAMAEHGADVAILDLQEELAADVAAHIKGIGRRSCALACDVHDAERIREAVDSAADRLGRLDVLVNAAGRGRQKPLIEMSQSEFEDFLVVYLTAAFTASQAVVRHIICQATPGSIIHISSISSVRALGRGTGAYAAAKAGLNALVREMAVEWAPHRIRVNAVAPCQIKSPQFEQFLDSGQYGDRETLTSKLISAIPLGRFGEPDEIAGPCVFLASEAASLITGQILFVDGGNTAQ